MKGSRKKNKMMRIQIYLDKGLKTNSKTPYILAWEFTIFSMIYGLVVDVMHCLYLGAMRELCCLCFDTDNHASAYYVES